MASIEIPEPLLTVLTDEGWTFELGAEEPAYENDCS